MLTVIYLEIDQELSVKMAVVEASMNFLVRDTLYNHEKPYQLRYAPTEGTPTTTFQCERKAPINIQSIRGRDPQFSVKENGFGVMTMKEEMPYSDFSKPEGVQRYLNAVCQQLKEHLGAEKVQAYQYLVCRVAGIECSSD